MVSDGIEQYQRDGYWIARGLFSSQEAESYRAHYMALREGQEHFGDLIGAPLDGDRPDPLKQYPRMTHMHRWDQTSLNWLLDTRLRDCLVATLGHEPFAVLTMLYFKPPGARGQALHQDNYFLKVQPGTCIAAWMALDDCDIENGCLQVVPGSQNWEVLCTIKADTTQSFVDETVPLPPGVEPVPAIMKAGDVLFFNGQLVHGSFANTTADRFRRSMIGHYMVAEAEKIAEYYHPVLRMDGTPVEFGVSVGGGACGVWVEKDGTPVLEMQAQTGAPAPDHE